MSSIIWPEVGCVASDVAAVAPAVIRVWPMDELTGPTTELLEFPATPVVV